MCEEYTDQMMYIFIINCMVDTTCSRNVNRSSLMVFLFSIWSQPEVIHVLLDRCLFGRRLVMTDILDADIDGYLPGNRVDGLNSSNPTTATHSPKPGPSGYTRTRLYRGNDTLSTKSGGGTKWATPTRNITLSMYLSERPNLVGLRGVMHITNMHGE